MDIFGLFSSWGKGSDQGEDTDSMDDNVPPILDIVPDLVSNFMFEPWLNFFSNWNGICHKVFVYHYRYC